MCHVDIIFIRIIVNLTINLACVHHVPLCVATRPIRCPGYVTPRHTTRITNDIQRPTRRNTMLITSATIKWPFPRNSSKHGTRSSTTRRTNSGIPKNKVQQTRLLHLAKGRKVTRKVICDAVGIYYATTTGNSEAAAEWVKDLVVAGSLIWLLTTVSRLISRFTFPRPMVANHVSPQPDMKPGDTTDIQEIDEANVSDLNAHDGLIEEIHDVFKAPEPE